MTSAKIQAFCRKYNTNIGCSFGKKINTRNITERKTSLFILSNHFCLIRKPQGISFDKAIEDELKPNFKVVHNVKSDKHVKCFIKYEYKPLESQSPLTNIVVYDLENFKKIRAVLFCSCIYKLSKISGKYHRYLTED